MQHFLDSISADTGPGSDTDCGSESGSGVCSGFDKSFNPRGTGARSDLVSMFNNALQRGRFLVLLQPVVEASTWRLLQNECLLRYKRADGVLFPAAQIVPLAEEIDVVTELDKFALEAAVRLLRKSPNLHLSVNVSRRSLADTAFRDLFTGIVASYPGMQKKLIVEITETALPDRKDDLQAFVQFLHYAGFRVAIDDFGVGATSWHELAGLEIDIVKFDMSLCAPDSEKAGLLRETVRRSKERGIYTIGEGVDSLNSAKRLSRLGVDALQGYLFGRPLP